LDWIVWEHGDTLWIGLDWVSEFVDWVGWIGSSKMDPWISVLHEVSFPIASNRTQ